MVGWPPRVHRRVYRSVHTQTSHRWCQDDRGKVQCTDTARSQRAYHLLSVTGLGHLIISENRGRPPLPLTAQVCRPQHTRRGHARGASHEPVPTPLASTTTPALSFTAERVPRPQV
jgi:hypothetical protein